MESGRKGFVEKSINALTEDVKDVQCHVMMPGQFKADDRTRIERVGVVRMKDNIVREHDRGTVGYVCRDSFHDPVNKLTRPRTIHVPQVKSESVCLGTMNRCIHAASFVFHQ